MVEDFIGVYEGAFPADYCDDVVREFNAATEQGFGFTRQEAGDMEKGQKDDLSIFTGQSWSSELDLQGLNNLIGQKFNETFAQCLNPYLSEFASLQEVPQWNVYGIKVQKTKVGQGYHIWHCEDLSRASCNRVLTYVVYLNDVEEGGETEFLYQHKRFKPKKGTVVIFPAAFTHTHRGNPPISNSKYIMTGWVEL